VKRLNRKQYHTPWSGGSVLYDWEYLRNHLLCIMSDSVGLEVKKPMLNTPLQRSLPQLGELWTDVMMNYKEDKDLRVDMERKAIEIRNDLIEIGKRDEVQLSQPSTSPSLHEGMELQVCCNYFND